MSLDVPTLMLAGSFVALLSGAMLVFAWYHYREMSPVLWWAAADVGMAIGVGLLAFGGVKRSELLLSGGFFFLTLSPALLWTSARLFNGLKLRALIVAAGPALVLCIDALPDGFPKQDLRGGIGTLFGATYLLAAAWTLAFRSREALVSRWPLAGLVMLHAAMLLTGAVAAARSKGAASAMPEVASIFGMIHFEALVFLIGTTIFVVAAMREASELRHKRAATTDSLTGLLNRREFLDRAERLLQRAQYDGSALAVVVMDLDSFKRINDTFGHATGDETLRVFADVTRRALRPNDLFGRLGGEEFAAILPGADIEAAGAVAERARRAFADAGAIIDGREIYATVSAGVAGTAGAADALLSDLLQRADMALYRAKRSGRNRVEMSGEGRPERNKPRLVRVA